MLFVSCFDSRGFHEIWGEGRFAVVEDLVEFFLDAAVAGGDLFDDRLEVTEIVEVGIEQVRAGDVGKCCHNGAADEGNISFELADQVFDAGALEVWLRAAKVTGNDRELFFFGIGRNVFFLAVGERTDDGVGSGI